MVLFPVRDWLTSLSGIFCFLLLLGCAASLPQNTGRDLDLGKEALEVEDYDAAIRYFKAYLKVSPNDADGHLQLGCALLKKGSLKEAVNAFKESIDLNPHNEKTRVLIKESLFNEADVFFSEGKNDIGMRYLTAHVTINPDDVDTHIILAKEFIKMGSTRNAMVCVNKAVELDPKHPEVVKLLDYFSDGFH